LTEASLANISVLVVDDEVDSRNLVKKLLDWWSNGGGRTALVINRAKRSNLTSVAPVTAAAFFRSLFASA
jgi:hypothetical protein